jgi:hypothetical protein
MDRHVASPWRFFCAAPLVCSIHKEELFDSSNIEPLLLDCLQTPEFPDEAADLVGAAAVPRAQASWQSPNLRTFG